MSIRKELSLLPAFALLVTPISGFSKTFTESLSSGKVYVNERLRYESVDDEAFAGNGEAMTLRSRIGYETSPISGFTLLMEFEDIQTIGDMDHFQTPPPPAPLPTGDAVIADPEQTEVNRFQIRYRGISKLDLVLGRQRIMYDNQRFVGNVGFRQDEQTFDAFSAIYTGIPDWTLSYAYADKVNGITPVFDANVNDTFTNIAYNGFTWGKFSAYAYLLDNQERSLKEPLTANVDVNAGLQFLTNDTMGLRFDGAYILPTTVPLRAIYRAEYAQQNVDKMSLGTNPSPARRKSFDVDYTLAELGMAYTFGGGSYALTPMLGYEELGSDNGKYGLQTPYATKHAFNGWVDQFLVTPNEGLVDKYVALGFDLNAYTTKIMVMVHDYESVEDNATTRGVLDLGTEKNIQVMKTIGANWILGAKYGSYSEGPAADVAASKKRDSDKFWLWAELNF